MPGIIEDGSKLWWDIRPSVRFPTLEMRVADVCTRLDDGIAIAALYRCLLRMLWRLKRDNQRWRRYAGMLVNENRWRAQRYGVDEGLVDFGKGRIVPYAELLEEIILLTARGPGGLRLPGRGRAEARAILARGTSAHRQLADLSRGSGRRRPTPREALDGGGATCSLRGRSRLSRYPVSRFEEDPAMDDKTRTELEAAAFRRLVAHLRERTDVQNIDLMNLAGFCRNCLSKWYRAEAVERGHRSQRSRRPRDRLWRAL